MSRETEPAPAFLRILLYRLRFPILFVVIGLIVLSWDRVLYLTGGWFRPERADGPASSEHVWFCPMHPSIVRSELANCPSCGMPLSQRLRGEEARLPDGVLARVELSPYRIRQAGIATSEVAYRTLVREIEAVGFIEYDDRRITQVLVKIAGRVDEVFVAYKGARVRAGDPLYRLNSPGSLPPQRELLTLLNNYEQAMARAQPDEDAQTRALNALNASRQRLRLWGFADADIAALESSREVKSQITAYSPASGVVLESDIQVGKELIVGQRPYTIADDSEIKVELAIFEQDLPLIALGQDVEIAADAFGAERLFGTVLAIDPELDETTRTVKASLAVRNEDGRLKPGMYVTGRVWLQLGRTELLTEPPPPDGAPAAPAPRKVFVCDMHRATVSDAPGNCSRCGTMELEELSIAAGAVLVFRCPVHADVQSEQPGVCPRDGRALEFRVVSQPARAVTGWVCPVHPFHASSEPATCPDSGKEFRLVRREELLAVPASAVLDTGKRKIVFIDRGGGVFEAVEVLLGPRAGEHFPATAGLDEGDRVATAGAFLLDAEANLVPGASAAYFGSTGHESHR